MKVVVVLCVLFYACVVNADFAEDVQAISDSKPKLITECKAYLAQHEKPLNDYRQRNRDYYAAIKAIAQAKCGEKSKGKFDAIEKAKDAEIQRIDREFEKFKARLEGESTAEVGQITGLLKNKYKQCLGEERCKNVIAGETKKLRGNVNVCALKVDKIAKDIRQMSFVALENLVTLLERVCYANK